jgi:hypothetical protein
MPEILPTTREGEERDLRGVQLLSTLTAYDPAIQSRVDDIHLGLSPNGHSPNGVLSEAIEQPSTEAAARFTGEYNWAMALSTYPYHRQEARDVLMCAAIDALYLAGQSYEPNHEPNFLRHFSDTSRNFFNQLFADPKIQLDLPVDRFDDLVIDTHIADLPPLASRRLPEDFAVGQSMLVLYQGKLVLGKVQEIHPNEVRHTLGTLSEDERKSLEQLIYEQTKAGVDWRQVLSPEALEDTSDQKTDAQVRDHQEHPRWPSSSSRVGITVNGETPLYVPRFTGDIPSPDFLHITGLFHSPSSPQLAPLASPGFLKLGGMEEAPYSFITDMHHNYVIDPAALSHLKNDPLYRELWLSNGSGESLRRRPELEKAIASYITLNRLHFNGPEEKKRARTTQNAQRIDNM